MKVFTYLNALTIGTTSVSEELQVKIEHVLHGIPYCKNIADYIILYGTNVAELDKAYISELERFAEYNSTFNIQKFEFYTEKFEFFVSPSEAKITAINNLPPPTNISELPSFIAMTKTFTPFCTTLRQTSKHTSRIDKKRRDMALGGIVATIIHFNPTRAGGPTDPATKSVITF